MSQACYPWKEQESMKYPTLENQQASTKCRKQKDSMNTLCQDSVRMSSATSVSCRNNPLWSPLLLYIFGSQLRLHVFIHVTFELWLWVSRSSRRGNMFWMHVLFCFVSKFPSTCPSIAKVPLWSTKTLGQDTLRFAYHKLPKGKN